jgi:hypothetical protein
MWWAVTPAKPPINRGAGPWSRLPGGLVHPAVHGPVVRGQQGATALLCAHTASEKPGDSLDPSRTPAERGSSSAVRTLGHVVGLTIRPPFTMRKAAQGRRRFPCERTHFAGLPVVHSGGLLPGAAVGAVVVLVGFREVGWKDRDAAHGAGMLFGCERHRALTYHERSPAMPPTRSADPAFGAARPA